MAEELNFDDTDGLGFDDEGAAAQPLESGGLFPEDAPAEDPIGEIEYTGTDAEADMAATLDAVESAFSKRAKAEQERFRQATDSEYWFAVVAETREQKEFLLRVLGWLALGDKYIDAYEIARLMGIKLPPANVPYVPAKPDRKLNDLSLPLE